MWCKIIRTLPSDEFFRRAKKGLNALEWGDEGDGMNASLWHKRVECMSIFYIPSKSLTHSHTMTPFNAPGKQAF